MFRKKERFSVGWRPGEGWWPAPGQARSIELFLWGLERFPEAIEVCQDCQLKPENCSGLRAKFLGDELHDVSAYFTHEALDDYQFRRVEKLIRRKANCRPIYW